MPTLDETHTRLAYEVAIYREQMVMLQKEMERVSLATLDLSNAGRTIKDIGKEQVLIPIGGGAYVKGNVQGEKIIIPIGMQYLLEMEKSEAGTEISRRIESTRKAITRLNDEFQKISVKLREVSAKLKKVEEHVRISSRVEESASEDYI